MTDQRLTFIIAFWGAALSTLLAIPRVIEFLYAIKHKLKIMAYSEQPFGTLTVAVTNVGRRPINITSLVLLYGPEPSLANEASRCSNNLPQKLEEGDVWTASILRADVMSDAKKNNVRQSYNHRLWVGVLTSTGKRFNSVVSIDPSIIAAPYDPNAVYYVTADVFLGFPQMKSIVVRHGIKR